MIIASMAIYGFSQETALQDTSFYYMCIFHMSFHKRFQDV